MLTVEERGLKNAVHYTVYLEDELGAERQCIDNWNPWPLREPRRLVCVLSFL